MWFVQRGPKYSALILLLLAVLVIGCGSDGPDEKESSDGDTATAVESEGKDGEEAPVVEEATEFDEAEPVEDAERRYKLNLAPAEGDKYTYRIRMDAETEVADLRSKDEVTYDFTTRVTGINSDGSVTLEMNYNRIRVKKRVSAGVIDSIPRTISYDTKGGGASEIPGAKDYDALVGMPVLVTISSAGVVREVSNLDPVITAVIKARGASRDTLPTKVVQAFRETVKLQMYQTVIQQLFLQAVPDTGVVVGGGWSRRDEIPMAGVPSQSTISYSLTDVRTVKDRPVGQIDLNLTTRFLEKKVDDEMLSATIDDIDFSGSGVMLVNLQNGFPVRKSTEINMRMQATGSMKVGPGKGKVETVSRRASSKMTAELVNFSPAE